MVWLSPSSPGPSSPHPLTSLDRPVLYKYLRAPQLGTELNRPTEQPKTHKHTSGLTSLSPSYGRTSSRPLYSPEPMMFAAFTAEGDSSSRCSTASPSAEPLGCYSSPVGSVSSLGSPQCQVRLLLLAHLRNDQEQVEGK